MSNPPESQHQAHPLPIRIWFDELFDESSKIAWKSLKKAEHFPVRARYIGPYRWAMLVLSIGGAALILLLAAFLMFAVSTGLQVSHTTSHVCTILAWIAGGFLAGSSILYALRVPGVDLVAEATARELLQRGKKASRVDDLIEGLDISVQFKELALALCFGFVSFAIFTIVIAARFGALPSEATLIQFTVGHRTVFFPEVTLMLYQIVISFVTLYLGFYSPYLHRKAARFFLVRMLRKDAESNGSTLELGLAIAAAGLPVSAGPEVIRRLTQADASVQHVIQNAVRNGLLDVNGKLARDSSLVALLRSSQR